MNPAIDHEAFDYDLELPLLVALASGESLKYVELLRLVPGRRAVLRAEWQREASCLTVVAKVFFGRGPRRAADREERGLGCLATLDIAAPRVLGRRRAGAAEIVLLEDLGDLRQLDEPRLVEVDGLLTKMHESAIRHVDLHRGNLLSDGRRLIVLDGAAVRGGRFDRHDALARWVSEFPLDGGPAAPALVDAPVVERTRAYGLERIRAHRLERIRAHRVRRARRIIAKSFRETTAVAASVSRDQRWLTVRGAELLPEDLNAAVACGDERLKSGRTATVVRAGDTVIKRGNRKSWWHGLRISLRASRAARSWANSHAARAFGLPVPAPIALWERSVFGYRTESFFAYRYVEGEPLDQYVAREGWDDALVERVANLFARFADCGFVHGDCKASNFIVTVERELVVVDLDAAQFCAGGERLRARLRRDVERFLANWGPTAPPLLGARLEAALGSMSS